MTTNLSCILEISGFTHNIESIIEIAEEGFKENEDIIFFIIGKNQLKKNELMSWVKDRNLKNCYFFPWQTSPQDLKYSFSAADISIITLTDETALVSVPSKTYNLLACR